MSFNFGLKRKIKRILAILLAFTMIPFFSVGKSSADALDVSEIIRVPAGMNADAVMNSFYASKKIVDGSGSALSAGEDIATGYRIYIDTKVYTLVVPGDVNGDGKLTVTDVAYIKSVIMAGNGSTDEIVMCACDADSNGVVSSSDYLRLVYHLRGKINIHSELSVTLPLEKEECAVIRIDTEGKKSISSDTVYINTTVSVSNTDEQYCFEKLSGRVRGRGNATWDMAKRSYKLKFDEKVNMLGIGGGANKDWVLLASHADRTLLRSALVFYMGQQMSGLEYTSAYAFTELYINGKYQGVYLLCEQVETAKHRVNVDDSGTDTDIGYLVELDAYAIETPGETYVTVNNKYYTIKSDGVSEEQLSFIQDYLKQCLDAINSRDEERISELIDIDSAVDVYIAQEYFKNIDVGFSSFYMYKKPGGKLYFGPLWDFDLSMGNDGRLHDGSSEHIYAAVSGYRQSNCWLYGLMRCKWFVKKAVDRWFEVEPIIESVINEADRLSYVYRDAIDRNFERWNVTGLRINYPPQIFFTFKNYDQHYGYLKNWLLNRKAWLDNYYSQVIKNGYVIKDSYRIK